MSIKLSSAKELAWSATLWGVISIFSFLLRVDLFKQAWGGPSLLTVIKAKKGATLAQEEADMKGLPRNCTATNPIKVFGHSEKIKISNIKAYSGDQLGRQVISFLPN